MDGRQKEYIPSEDYQWRPSSPGDYLFYIENTSLGRDCGYEIKIFKC
jgi:hypothetical protein